MSLFVTSMYIDSTYLHLNMKFSFKLEKIMENYTKNSKKSRMPMKTGYWTLVSTQILHP